MNSKGFTIRDSQDVYREKFGYLAFVRTRRAFVALILPNGSRLVPSDDQPAFNHPNREEICLIPRAMVVLRQSYINGLVRSRATSFLGELLLPERKEAFLRTWPEESGGLRQLEEIEARLEELRRDPSLREAPSIEDFKKYGTLSVRSYRRKLVTARIGRAAYRGGA